ncbi:membrane protein insertion efficiency factor YidD [Thermodesulfobacteriota bacterium]
MVKKTTILLVRSYQKYISPLLGHTCKFTPSCSQYCIDSITKLGIIKGLYYAVIRILKCHPLFNSDYEYDPVKEKL